MNNLLLFALILSACTIFAQTPVNVNEGFENSWLPSGWTQSSFSQVNTINHTSGGTYSAGHSMILFGSATLSTAPFAVLSGEQFDTISFWVYQNAVSISGSLSVDIIGSSSSSNLALINLNTIPAAAWKKYSFSYNVTVDDNIFLKLSIIHNASC